MCSNGAIAACYEGNGNFVFVWTTDGHSNEKICLCRSTRENGERNVVLQRYGPIDGQIDGSFAKSEWEGVVVVVVECRLAKKKRG